MNRRRNISHDSWRSASFILNNFHCFDFCHTIYILDLLETLKLKMSFFPVFLNTRILRRHRKCEFIRNEKSWEVNLMVVQRTQWVSTHSNIYLFGFFHFLYIFFCLLAVLCMLDNFLLDDAGKYPVKLLEIIIWWIIFLLLSFLLPHRIDIEDSMKRD